MKCGRCGHEVAEGMRFCTNCGVRLEQGEPRQAAGEKSEYRVVFERVNKFYGMAQKFVVKVDDAEVCQLKNGETKEVRLAKGRHSVTISMLGTRSRKFVLDVNEDQHIRCYGSAAKGMTNPLLFTPIVAENRDGVRL